MKINETKNANVEQVVNISIEILPFGHIRLNYTLNGEKPNVKKRMPVYVEPLTTNIEKVEILYEGGERYKVPETTA